MSNKLKSHVYYIIAVHQRDVDLYQLASECVLGEKQGDEFYVPRGIEITFLLYKRMSFTIAEGAQQYLRGSLHILIYSAPQLSLIYLLYHKIQALLFF